MSTYTKIKTLPLSLFNNAEYLSFMNHVLDLANGNSGGGDSESPDEISLLTGSDGIPELGLTKEFLDTYEADLLAMADVVDESRTSQETEQMTLHDTNRDNLAIYIITRISRAGTLPLEAERDAGKYLYKVIKPYNGIARLPMAQETAKIKGLLLDLRKDENKPYVTTLGLGIGSVGHRLPPGRPALATEQRCRTAICDTDPLKLHYTWGLRQLGVVSERHWQAAVAATRHTIAAGEIGFADAYFVQPVDPAVATSRAAGDVRRTRRNFALHLRLQPSLLDWYRTLDRVLPGRVAFGWPDALPQLSPRERCPGPAVFDALIDALPTP